MKKIDNDLYEVTGGMTLHGVTREVTIKVERTGAGKDPWGGYRVGAETSFTIKRSDYGMTSMPGVVGDDLKMTISIEAIRK